METLSDKGIKDLKSTSGNCYGFIGYPMLYKQEDVKEFIRDIPMGIKKCIERGQFNERYFENWLKERAGDKLI